MWKKLVCGAIVAVVVGLVSLPDPALAGGSKHHRHYKYGYAGQHRHYSQHYHQHYYRPPVRYYAPPVRYYAPPVRSYAYPPYYPGVNVQIAVPLPFFSFYLW
jgi:hypothetical protein